MHVQIREDYNSCDILFLVTYIRFLTVDKVFRSCEFVNCWSANSSFAIDVFTEASRSIS